MGDLGELMSQLDRHGYAGHVESDVGAGIVYGTDNSVYQLRPAGVVVPASIDDLVSIVRANRALAEPFDLVARGGGTGTNGQSLTNGLSVDTRRSMNRIVSIDPEARTAVVQPGVVLGQLNAELAPHGLFFAPHVSTASRATIGGMVATDAAGKGSLVHGRTNDHVLSIEAVLDDGTRWVFRHVDDAELRALEQRPDRVGELHRALGGAVGGVTSDGFPDVPRGFTGYNLADAASTSGLDATKLLAGSEGTLALIGEITIRLSPVLDDPRLVVVSMPTFGDAIRTANVLKQAGPTAIECLDERTISLASTSPAFEHLAALLQLQAPDIEGALLLMEFEGQSGVDALHDLMPPAARVAATADPSVIAAVWKVRADAVGVLAQPVGGRRSVAFVEDCAVPPHRLESFVAEFGALLDAHGLSYGMFGHADVGCVHVRPALDLYDPEHERLLRTISDEVAALVSSFGGVLWGEHGRGFRGEYLDLSDELIHRMRQVKTAFDPCNTFNPGKLYTPLGSPDQTAEVIRIDAVPLRIHRDREVGAARRDEFDSAFSCNGNGICQHWGDAEVMCPSYKVTLDPRLSPKGRADLLRTWLHDPDDADVAEAVDASLRDCLSCGACTGRCPVQVDIPELKSRFLSEHSDHDRRRRVRHTMLARFESVLPTVQRFGAIGRIGQRAASPLLRRLLGTVDLPEVPSGSLRSRLDRLAVTTVGGSGSDVGDATVLVLPDAFSAFLDPGVLESAIVVLRAMGERPAVAQFVPSGKLDHVVGRRTRFARSVARQRALIEQLAPHGVPLVVVEPAVALLPSHEYRAIDPTFPHEAVTSLARFLSTRVERLPALGLGTSVQLFGHCTEVSLDPDAAAVYRSMLQRLGCTVASESTTCCGMAGVFGHEAENQAMSTALFDSGWRPKLESSEVTHRCASGYSCRSQAHRFGHSLVHPLMVVAEAVTSTDVR